MLLPGDVIADVGRRQGRGGKGQERLGEGPDRGCARPEHLGAKGAGARGTEPGRGAGDGERPACRWGERRDCFPEAHSTALRWH